MNENIISAYLAPIIMQHNLRVEYFLFCLLKKLSDYLLVILFSVLILIPTPVKASDYTILTTHLPPWSIQGESGIFPDLANEIERRLGSSHKPKVLPWSRAQKYAKAESNILIFPLSRVPIREKHYKWIIKVMPIRFAFGSFKSPALDLDKARKLKRILVHQDAPPYYFLIERGFNNLFKKHEGVETMIGMLKAGRADAWFTSPVLMKYAIHGTSSEGHLNIGPSENEVWLYIAGSKDFPEKLANDYRLAFKAIKTSGMYEKIIQKYIGKKM